jgi:PTH1 family peptidyl-tRNA hydrolase
MLLEWQKRNNFANFEFYKQLKALVSENKKVVLILPETMMNRSGDAIKPALRAFKVKPRDVIVLHDDADIEFSHVKLSFGKHSAGHKGVESVKRALGTWDFWRLRIGIQKKKRVEAMKLVLQKFTPQENIAIKKTKKKILEGLALIVENGPEYAMNTINQN